jgi:hypothetical protein
VRAHLLPGRRVRDDDEVEGRAQGVAQDRVHHPAQHPQDGRHLAWRLLSKPEVKVFIENIPCLLNMTARKDPIDKTSQRQNVLGNIMYVVIFKLPRNHERLSKY